MCVGDVDRFEREHWGRAPLLARSVDVDPSLRELCTVADIDTIVSTAASGPTIRMVQGGVNEPPARYCTPTRLGNQTVTRVADVRKVLDRYRAGSTLVLQSLHRTWAPVATWTAALEAEISHRVQTNAYLTPPGATGLAPHADGHDVLVIQMHGTKHWHAEGIGDVDLGPGDVMYLPRGTQHSATANRTASLHLTVGIHPTDRRRIVQRVIARIDAWADEPLPLGYARLDPAELIDLVADTLTRTADLVGAADAKELSRSLTDRRPRRFHRGALRAAIERPPLHDATLIVAAVPFEIEATCDERLTMTWRDGTLTLPDFTRAALETIRGAATSITIRELTDLDAASRSTLARRLLDEGVLELC